MTLTLLAPKLATYTRFVAGLAVMGFVATPSEPLAVATVAITVFDVPSITETLFDA